MIKGIMLSLITEVYAGSCYYEHMNVFTPNPFEFYTNTTTHYEYCLAGCCGAYKRGGINQCCDSTGATIGILIAFVLFVGLVVTAGFVYRQKRRRLLLVNAGSNAGSCYYKQRQSFFYNDYSIYEYCLTGCCGSTEKDGIKHCCEDAGAIIGIFLGAAGFLAFLLIICALCKRRHRSDAFVIRGSNEQGRLIPPTTPATQYPSATGHKHYESQANYQQANTTTGYIYPPQTGNRNIYSHQITHNAPAYQN
ncbi:unnamed protein product [Mytilus edulis]|uniref:Uncharacterized protein n=1 Tax=Mytilus edulis TaxID=6550 RepID=A0A8S3T1D8_MYTED|nr:unnamed protein product [Mytilus edulis]